MPNTNQPRWMTELKEKYPDVRDQAKIVARGAFSRRQLVEMLGNPHTSVFVAEEAEKQLLCDIETKDGEQYRFHQSGDYYVIKQRTYGPDGNSYGGWSFKDKFPLTDPGRELALEAWIDLCAECTDWDQRGLDAGTLNPGGDTEPAEVIEPEVLPPETQNPHTCGFSIEAAENWHFAAQHHAQLAVICAARSGAELNKIKAQCKQGDWQKVVKELPFSADTAKRYRDLATQLEGRLQELGSGDAFDLLLLPEPENLTDPIYAEQLEQINQVTGEQTLRQLYFDWGIVKPPKQLGGARESSKEDEPLPPGETATHLAAKGVLGELQDKLFKFCLHEPSMQIQHLKLHELEKLHGTLLDSTREVAALIKAG